MQQTMAVIRKFAPNFTPKIGIILGSGLSMVAEELTHPITIPYQAIPGIHASSVVGHASLLLLGYLQDIPVVCLKGRLHLYEGASYESLCTLIRIVRQLGASELIVTGAVGSLKPEVGHGEVVLLNDHINFQPGNPLVGINDESIGPRFLSLENAYDEELRGIFLRVATQLNIPVHQGVYISLLGPSFETPAEIRAYRMLGADVVGMAVVPDVIIARHCGLRVTGVCAVTNLAVGLSPERVTHEATLHYGEIAARKLVKLIPAFVKEVGLAI
ncbi:MAG: xapA [Gammaproteobacteria bacterium]|nr:xapA [Gammaproteobacteria bacterium]